MKNTQKRDTIMIIVVLLGVIILLYLLTLRPGRRRQQVQTIEIYTENVNINTPEEEEVVTVEDQLELEPVMMESPVPTVSSTTYEITEMTTSGNALEDLNITTGTYDDTEYVDVEETTYAPTTYDPTMNDQTTYDYTTY